MGQTTQPRTLVHAENRQGLKGFGDVRDKKVQRFAVLPEHGRRSVTEAGRRHESK